MKIKGVRELVRTVFDIPAVVVPGDTIELAHERKVSGRGMCPDCGKAVPPEHNHRRVVLRNSITEAYTFTEGVIFEADAGVFGKGRALGGAFIE